jgi:hypothetical protein
VRQPTYGGQLHHDDVAHEERGDERGVPAAGSGQWAVGSGQWAVGSAQWAVGSGQ